METEYESLAIYELRSTRLDCNSAIAVSPRIDTLERPRSNNLERFRPTKDPALPRPDLASMCESLGEKQVGSHFLEPDELDLEQAPGRRTTGSRTS